MRTRSIAVFCGSAHGADPRHAERAREVGRDIARRGWSLVYGGGRVGLMGEVADAALAAGAPVYGVITRFLYEWEVGHDGLTDLEIVDTLTERKLRMGELADGFLVLPGGIGTMDELFDSLTLRQTQRMQPIPIVLFGREYWDQVIDFEFLANEGVIRDEHLALIEYAETPQQAWDVICRFHQMKRVAAESLS